MKCPNCGQWNRETFPACYKCGFPLKRDEGGQDTAVEQGRRLDDYLIENNNTRNYTRIDENGQESAQNDSREELALEMQNLQKRIQQGRERQQNLREAGAIQGIAPSGRGIEYPTERVAPDLSRTRRRAYREEEVEGEIRPNAQKIVSQREIAYENETYTTGLDQPSSMENPFYMPRRVSPPAGKVRLTRNRLRRRLVRALSLLLIVAAAGIAAYQYVYLPYVTNTREQSLASKVEITPSILGDSAAHTIKIPGEEGTVIYIKELRRSYTVTGGYATVEVADYIWYENENAQVTESEVTATITPYLKTNAGEQVALEQLHYQVEVPESPLILVTPDTGYAEVSTAIYNIQFRVEKTSSVTINGEDFSDLVNTQDGLISYNATIQPIGNNYFEIKTRCQYYRENTTTVVIYRARQDIPLDLSTTLSNRSSNSRMTITATTLAGATVTVSTPHEDLDISTLNVNGQFSFKAVFENIGTNTITITASYPGKEPSVVNYEVYYLPPAAEYTRKAWPLDSWNYSELLSSIATRVATSQIYVCIGRITSIISTSPQLAIMETGDASSSREVMLENRSTDTWVVGERYRVYADVFGLYSGIPRLVGRYTYPPLN